MVLMRTLVVAAMLAGCGQSLFDSHGDDDGKPDAGKPDGGTGVAPTTCPAPCLADAAGDFNGSARGAGDRWRYLDDHRDRTWAAMTAGATQQGADNHIAACAATPNAPACAGLPNALLLSAGSATADPAVELTLAAAQVVQLTVVAYTTSADRPVLRLYRNSREDALLTVALEPNTAMTQTITVDTLAGDRFLAAIAGARSDVAVHVFATKSTDAFPSTCQLSLAFEAATGNTVDNACGKTVAARTFTHKQDGVGENAPMFAAGPFTELGKGADNQPDQYYVGDDQPLDLTGDITVQLWVKQRAFVQDYSSWPFSTLDMNKTGGLGIEIVQISGMLDISTCLTVPPQQLTFQDVLTPYPNDGNWHFIRVTHSGTLLRVCIDGTERKTATVPVGFLKTTIPTYVGRDAFWTPQGAFTNAMIDDIRVTNGALPCD